MDTKARRDKRRTALLAALAAAGMFSLAFAGYPLYRIFCKTTGYGGAPKSVTAEEAAGREKGGGRVMQVRFNADVDANMRWRFAPESPFLEKRVGEQITTYFLAKNLSDKTETGMATFNAAPDQAGGYVSKIECFCYTEQTLAPGEERRMPVTFYIDPAIEDDLLLKEMNAVTLSYSFHLAKK
jgi:cytochrome c oxidase assembly protein subunit 11